ncbi:MAG: hypothetical protein Q8P13_05480 [bacterium]|nr:hypothetical protein [bacterium]
MFTREDYDRLVDALAETEIGNKVTKGIPGSYKVEDFLREVTEVANALGFPPVASETIEGYARAAREEIVRGGKRHIDQILLEQGSRQRQELAMHM